MFRKRILLPSKISAIHKQGSVVHRSRPIIYNLKPTTSSGFTLFEILIATAIFVFVLLIAVGAFSQFSRQQRRQIAEQERQEDIRLAMQLFSREARTAFGSTYRSINNGQGVTFRNQEGICVMYLFANNQTLIRNTATDPGDCDNLGLYHPTNDQVMTDPGTEATIQQLQFKVWPATVDPATASLLNQGIITVIIEATTPNTSSPPLHVQTSVTSRQLNPYLVTP